MAYCVSNINFMSFFFPGDSSNCYKGDVNRFLFPSMQKKIN